MAEGPDPKTCDRQLGDDHASSLPRPTQQELHRKRSVPIRLAEDDLVDLLKITENAAHQWVGVGLRLRFSKSELDELLSHPRLFVEGVPGFFREMISRWLKWAPPRHDFPTIDALVSALRDVGEENMAYTLEHHYEGIPVTKRSLLSVDDSEEADMESPRERSNDDAVFSPGAGSVEGIDHPRVYGCECGDCTFANVLEKGCPQSIPTISGLPFLNTSGLNESEKDYLIGKLLADSRMMLYSFQRLVSRTCTSLEKRGITPKQLVDHLIALGPLDPVLRGSDGGPLHKGLSAMRNADTVGDVFFQIREYMSFFNYEILEHIVEELGTDGDRAELDKYKDTFRDYCRRRAVECPPWYGKRSTSGHVCVVVKFAEDLEKYTVAELKVFQKNLSAILNVTEYALCLISVDKGCLELTFQMPLFLKQKLFPLSAKQEEALKSEGVIKLQCDEHHIPTKEQASDHKGEDYLHDGTGPSLTSSTTGGTSLLKAAHEAHRRYTPPKPPSSRQGGYECEFVNPPPEAFQTKCPICLNILCDAQEADCCGNNFCRTCIERVQEDQIMPCPMCKEPLTMHPNKGLKRSLNQLGVQCTHQKSGCGWVGELGELDKHLNSSPTSSELLSGCEYNEIECEFSQGGCTTRIPRKDMAAHIQKAQQHHIKLLTHQLNEKVKELKQSQELNKKLQQRNEEVMQKSLNLENKLKELTEKKDTEIERLRQALQDKEKQAHLNGNDADSFPDHSTIDETHPLEAAITQLASYNLPPQPMQVNHCFTLENFEDKKKKNMVCFSEPFFTHPQGYKMCVQMYPNGHGEGKGTHITVSTCIMRGENDDQVPWPFRGEIVIELLNQKGNEGHHEAIIGYDDRAHTRHAGRITSTLHKRNSAFGFNRFVSHDEIYSQSDSKVQYLKDGCLKFRVREIQLNH